MSRNQSLKVIERELKRLNERIDLKILHGQGYATESKMHKMLLGKIRKMHKAHFFGRLSNAVYSFFI